MGFAIDWLFALIISALLGLFLYAVFPWMESNDEAAWHHGEDSVV
jgi:hypothetical protein